MANLPKPPMLIALGSTTIRSNSPNCPTCYLSIDIMKPAVHSQSSDGEMLEPGAYFNLYLAPEDAKLFADALYAQGALDFVE